MQSVSHSQKMALISVGFYYLIGKPGVLGNGLTREEEEVRDTSILFTSSLRRHEKLTKAREFQETTSPDPKFSKNRRNSIVRFFYFALP